jgi:hypothetical protein
MTDAPSSPQLPDIDEAVPLYTEYFTSKTLHRNFTSILPGRHLTTHVFSMAAQAALLDPENEAIVPESPISSYVEEESSE